MTSLSSARCASVSDAIKRVGFSWPGDYTGFSLQEHLSAGAAGDEGWSDDGAAYRVSSPAKL